MQQKKLCFLAIFYLVLFSMKTAAAAGEAEFYLEPMIVTAARYDKTVQVNQVTIKLMKRSWKTAIMIMLWM